MHRMRVWTNCRLSQHLNDLRAPLARLNSSGIFDKPLTKSRLGIWNPGKRTSERLSKPGFFALGSEFCLLPKSCAVAHTARCLLEKVVDMLVRLRLKSSLCLDPFGNLDRGSQADVWL